MQNAWAGCVWEHEWMQICMNRTRTRTWMNARSTMRTSVPKYAILLMKLYVDLVRSPFDCNQAWIAHLGTDIWFLDINSKHVICMYARWGQTPEFVGPLIYDSLEKEFCFWWRSIVYQRTDHIFCLFWNGKHIGCTEEKHAPMCPIRSRKGWRPSTCETSIGGSRLLSFFGS